MGSKAVMKRNIMEANTREEHDIHEESSDRDKQGNPQASTDEGKQIQNMDHEGHSPKHVLAASPRQGAMISSPKVECQTTKKKTKKSSKLPKEGAQ